MAVVPKPVIQPVHQPMYPTFASLNDAVAYALSEMPSIDRNVVLQVLGSYHNTLIAALPTRSQS